MSVELTYTDNQSGVRVPCKNVMIVGRDETSDTTLIDTLVSRNHAKIRCLDDTYYFMDSGSSNGSHINGKPITLPTALHGGVLIKLGSTTLTFEQQGSHKDFSNALSYQQTVIIDQPSIKNITVLVADIRDFTTISEQTPILTLTRVMTKWFEKNNLSYYP